MTASPRLLIVAALALSLAACASSTKKYEYPPTTNATDEIQVLETQMSTAIRNQVNVLSPNHFADARKKLDEAKKENQNRKSNADVLEDLGYARAHLDAANAVAPKVEAAIPEVVKARNDALTADAIRLRNADLIDADNKLKKTTEDFESGSPKVDNDKRADLQKKYLDVELSAIKAGYLDESKALIEAAKKMDAKKYAEATLTSAEAKYQTASRTIDTDRHNTGAIVPAADAARAEAKRAVEITKMAKGVKNQTPEEAAIALEAKNNEAARQAALAERSSNRLDSARDTIRDRNATIGALGADNTKLAGQERFNQAFTTAQQSFSSDEAEVYRQGDNLVVRLKQMQFPTGRAELPQASLDVLAKVKDVITSMGAESVVVEGHTDAVGSKAKNMTLSSKRAEAVAKYFKTENVVAEDHIQAKGYGDTKPLVSNKTKDGRAQNRRVDVVITPAKAPGNVTSKDEASSSASSAERPAPPAPPAPGMAPPAPESAPPAPHRWEE